MTAPAPRPSSAPVGRTLPELAQAAELSEDARALALPGVAPRDYVAALVDGGLFPDAVRFLAHALPRREAVWWAWFCARRAAGAEPAPPVRTTLDATERWVAQPNDDHRRAAMAAAEAGGLDSPASFAAVAAFMSGGSMAPPDVPAVPPGEFMTAKMVAAAVTMSAVVTEPEKGPEKFKAFIDQGLDVVRRIRLWDAPAPQQPGPR